MIKVESNTGLSVNIQCWDEYDLSSFYWRFSYMERKHTLECQSYTHYTRKTKRHKWVADQVYYSNDKRSNTLQELPPPPPEIVEAARNEFVNSLQVTWSKPS